MSLQELVDRIKKEFPRYIFVGEAHFVSEPKEFTSELVTELRKQGVDVGLYVEALHSTANVQKGNYDGDVIRWDKQLKGMGYRGLIDSVKDGVPVHGIDHPEYPSRIKDSESRERVEWWKKFIEEGTEKVKVVFVGGGHIWNNNKNPADIVSLMRSPFWLVENDRAYLPPIPIETFSFQYNSSEYKVALYKPQTPCNTYPFFSIETNK